MRAKLIVVAAAMLLIARAIHAHHSTTPVYDSQRTVTKTGVVSSFKFVNPHAMLTLDVVEEGGRVVPWTVEFDGRVNMTRFGWTDETVKPGDHITVTGSPTHNDSPRMFFIVLERPDGTRLQRAMARNLDAIEEARRQRAGQKQ